MQNPRLNFLPPPLRTKTPPRRDSCRALSHPRCFVRPDQLRPHVFARAKAAERGPAAVPAWAALTLGIHPSASSPPGELGWSRRKTIRVELGKKIVVVTRAGVGSVGGRPGDSRAAWVHPGWAGRKISPELGPEAASLCASNQAGSGRETPPGSSPPITPHYSGTKITTHV